MLRTKFGSTKDVTIEKCEELHGEGTCMYVNDGKTFTSFKEEELKNSHCNG